MQRTIRHMYQKKAEQQTGGYGTVSSARCCHNCIIQNLQEYVNSVQEFSLSKQAGICYNTDNEAEYKCESIMYTNASESK